MSNARAKAERSHAKDLRQGVVEQRPVSSGDKKKKKKQWAVRVDYGGIFSKMWGREGGTVIGKYASRAAAEQAAKSAERHSFYTNVRIEEI